MELSTGYSSPNTILSFVVYFYTRILVLPFLILFLFSLDVFISHFFLIRAVDTVHYVLFDQET